MLQLSADMQTIFDNIQNEVMELAMEWVVFRTLFAEPESINLLNEAGPNVFYTFQLAMLDDITMTLSRLTDKAKVAGKDTAGLEYLMTALDPIIDAQLIANLRSQLTILNNGIDPFRDRRNRSTAHLDKKIVLKIDSLPGISRAQVHTALTELYAFMNIFEKELTGKPQSYEHIILTDDGSSLLELLKRGTKHRNAELDELKRLSQPPSSGSEV